jgi:hypothetical protein
MSLWSNLKAFLPRGAPQLKRLARISPPLVRALAGLSAGDVSALREMLAPNVALDDRDLALIALAESALVESEIDRAGAIERQLDRLCRTQPCPEVFALRSAIRFDRGTWLRDEDRAQGDALIQSSEADTAQGLRLSPGESVFFLQSITQRRFRNDVNGARRAFHQVQRTDPHSYAAQRALCLALTEKWGGSHAEMFEHARNASAGLAHGRPLHALVAFAHLERWVYAKYFDSNQRTAALYARNAEVKAEVEQAHDRWRAANPPHGAAALRARADFAFWFYVVEDRERLVPELRGIDRLYLASPWGYLGDSEEALKEVYAFAGL